MIGHAAGRTAIWLHPESSSGVNSSVPSLDSGNEHPKTVRWNAVLENDQITGLGKTVGPNVKHSCSDSDGF